MANEKKYVVDLKIPRDNKKKTLVLNLTSTEDKSKKETSNGKKKKTYFFGWENIKWFIREIAKIYSPEPSYFSKKRVESSIAFIIAQIGMVYWIMAHYQQIPISEFLLWASAEFVISGYYVTQIQREKKNDPNSDTIVIEPEVIEEGVEEPPSEEEPPVEEPDLPPTDEPENLN